MYNAWMDYAIFEGAKLSGAVLQGSTLRWANFANADLYKANLYALLENARFTAARMAEADLSGATIVAADFDSARMEGVELHAARMDKNTNFTEAVLRKAALRSVTIPLGVLSSSQIAAMFGDGSVTLPDDLEPHRPAHWPAAALEWLDFEDERRRWQADPDGYLPPERR